MSGGPSGCSGGPEQCGSGDGRAQSLSPPIVHCSPGNEGGWAFYEVLGMCPVGIIYQGLGVPPASGAS